AINGGLFEKAGKAVGDTKNETNKEQTLGSGSIIDKYLYNISEKVASLPTYSEELLDETTEVLTENTKYISDGQVAVVPKGFKVIPGLNGSTSISDGLVIQDAEGNEFVWIPVTSDLGSSYSYSSAYSEPTELTSNYSGSSAAYDSQTTLNNLYGANYYNYAEDFKYADEYAEMVRSVNENNGFYIGRYETTIDDDGSVGSKNDTTVLTARTTLFTKDGTTYTYKWYGLYYAQKNANVTGNGEDVQTAMIYGVLYDKAMDFIRTQKAAGKTTYNVDTATSAWHSGSSVVNSGQANPGVTGDVALNIWDLESNAYEWTQEADSSNCRVFRGGANGYSFCASNRGCTFKPNFDFPVNSSRLALYIK
ncbi:MAG: hypothetical protein J6A29_02525, partial [Clostridia bacterium]|nr:hypothetical protein [Clostridia bacterium]